MRLTAPKKITWWIALALAVLGLIGYIVGSLIPIAALAIAAFCIVLVAAILLLVASFIAGL